MIHWSAICQYPGKKNFLFYSKAFVAADWNNVEEIAKQMVEEEWAEMSPHPAPPVIELIPGYIEYHRENK